MGPTEEIGCGVSVIEPGKVPNCWPKYTCRELIGKQFFNGPSCWFPHPVGAETARSIYWPMQMLA